MYSSRTEKGGLFHRSGAAAGKLASPALLVCLRSFKLFGSL